MSYAFGHLIGAWLGGIIYQKISNKRLKHFTWFFLLLGGILPDMDHLIDWTLGTQIHRTFTHSLLFPISVFLFTYLIFHLINKENKLRFSVAIAGGILIHLLLDMVGGYGIPLLWPNPLHLTYTSAQYLDPSQIMLLKQDFNFIYLQLKLAILDMALGTAWIFYLWYTKRLKFS